MNASEVMLWRRRRTPRWQSLSLAARGAAEGIAVALDDRGEVSLGRRGLPSLAALLGCSWDECSPAIDELLESGTYVYDAERRVLMDPQHAERQTAIAAVANAELAELRARVRELELELAEVPAIPILSMSPSAIRARNRRAKAGGNVGAVREQLSLPTTAVATTVATAVATAVEHPIAEKTAIPPKKRSAPRVVSSLQDPKDPDPTYLKNRIRDPRACARVEHDGDHPPAWAFAAALALRPDLAEWDVRECWRAFAKRTHTSEADAQKHFASWLRIEDPARRRGTAAKASPPAEEPPPPLERAADVHSEPPELPARPGATSRVHASPLSARARLRWFPHDLELQKAAVRELEAEDPPEPRSMSA